MGDSPEDMYFEDNYIGDIKAEKIEGKEEKMSLIFNLKRQMQKTKPTLKNMLFYYLF